MSTFKLSGRGGIKIGVFSANISLHFEKHKAMSSAIPAYTCNVVSSRA